MYATLDFRKKNALNVHFVIFIVTAHSARATNRNHVMGKAGGEWRKKQITHYNEKKKRINFNDFEGCLKTFLSKVCVGILRGTSSLVS